MKQNRCQTLDCNRKTFNHNANPLPLLYKFGNALAFCFSTDVVGGEDHVEPDVIPDPPCMQLKYHCVSNALLTTSHVVSQHNLIEVCVWDVGLSKWKITLLRAMPPHMFWQLPLERIKN